MLPATYSGDFPGGPMVENLPPNAGDVGLTPGPGAWTTHAAEQQRLYTTTTEPTPAGAATPQPEGSPPAAATTKTPCAVAETQKPKTNKWFFF